MIFVILYLWSNLALFTCSTWNRRMAITWISPFYFFRMRRVSSLPRFQLVKCCRVEIAILIIKGWRESTCSLVVIWAIWILTTQIEFACFVSLLFLFYIWDIWFLFFFKMFWKLLNWMSISTSSIHFFAFLTIATILSTFRLEDPIAYLFRVKPLFGNFFWVFRPFFTFCLFYNLSFFLLIFRFKMIKITFSLG